MRNLISFALILLIQSSMISQNSITVSETQLKVNGQPETKYRIRYHGQAPDYCLYANQDNSYDIGYLGKNDHYIHIVHVSEDDIKTDEFVLTKWGTTNQLLGFTKIPDTKTYVVGYSKDGYYGDKDYQLWICGMKRNGEIDFNTMIFGERPSDELWAKGKPASFSTSRIKYNDDLKLIGFFLGHTKKWNDGIRHQGSYMGLLNKKGEQLIKSKINIGESWHCSHDLDQRLLVSDSLFFSLSQGDGYPRALVFSRWDFNHYGWFKDKSESFYDIPQTPVYQDTDTELGGFARLNNGNFAIVHGSSHGRKKQDIRFVVVNEFGEMQKEKWLTNSTTEDCIKPRIARYGKHVLIAWEQQKESGPVSYFTVLDKDGYIIKTLTTFKNMTLIPNYDFINLPNGDIIWIAAREEQTFTVYRIKPEAYFFK